MGLVLVFSIIRDIADCPNNVSDFIPPCQKPDTYSSPSQVSRTMGNPISSVCRPYSLRSF